MALAQFVIVDGNTGKWRRHVACRTEGTLQEFK